jgi:hypothetical protein
VFVRGVVPPGSVLCVWPGVSYAPSELPHLPVRPQPTPVRSSLLLLLVLLRAVTDRRTDCLTGCHLCKPHPGRVLPLSACAAEGGA